MLGHLFDVGKLPQCHDLRQRGMCAGAAVWLEDPAEPDQLLKPPTQLVIGKHRTDSCIAQLFRLF